MNASNPRTALTTSASRLLALPNGGTESRWLCPGTGRLRLLPLPRWDTRPRTTFWWTASTRNWQTPVLSGSTWGLLTRKGAAFLHALQTLAAAKGVDLSFSLVYQGREEPLAELSPPAPVPAAAHQPAGRCAARVQVCCHPAGG